MIILLCLTLLYTKKMKGAIRMWIKPRNNKILLLRQSQQAKGKSTKDFSHMKVFHMNANYGLRMWCKFTTRCRIRRLLRLAWGSQGLKLSWRYSLRRRVRKLPKPVGSSWSYKKSYNYNRLEKAAILSWMKMKAKWFAKMSMRRIKAPRLSLKKEK